jgi:ElaB/YqjD/DUF883 family membrane-anchored ribosome-binding protein
MDKRIQAIKNDMSQLAEDARALMVATADVAGEKVEHARERLSAALTHGKEAYGRVREQAMEQAEAADKVVHDHTYEAIAIGFGAGALLGYVLACRCSRRRD